MVNGTYEYIECFDDEDLGDESDDLNEQEWCSMCIMMPDGEVCEYGYRSEYREYDLIDIDACRVDGLLFKDIDKMWMIIDTWGLGLDLYMILNNRY